MIEPDKNHLLIVWTSGERDVARRMVFMYAKNAKLNGWWEKLTLLIWGASTELICEDATLQEMLKELQETGIRTIACKSCAAQFELVDNLEALGVEVFPTGEYLTLWMKAGNPVLTF
jgi:hypothetical protein